MTQEELDSLMNGETDMNELDDIPDSPPKNNFSVETDKKSPPPPPTEDHKVVQQLDEVTKDTEVKGSQIFDQLETMSGGAEEIIKQAKNIEQYLLAQEELFSKLCTAFPHIQTFQDALESTKNTQAGNGNIIESSNTIIDASMQAMDLMQYQDIHRQKIERVINVMRALAQYMNSLFEGKIDDSKRAGSAVFIAGDSKEDIVNNEDIEALISSFAPK